MKLASRGYCVSVFDSFGEAFAHRGDAFVVVPGGSGSDFEAASATSCDEISGLEQSSPMDYASSL